MSAASGGMFFVACDSIARTHDSAFFAAAFAYSHAAQRGGGKAAMVVGKFEMRFWLPGIVACAQAQIFVESIGLDELAGIHLPIRIPKRLELTESLHEFWAEHFGI